MIRQNAPKTGAAFAVWGFTFSMCDCTLIAIRSKLKFCFFFFRNLNSRWRKGFANLFQFELFSREHF